MDKERTKADEYIIILFGDGVPCNAMSPIGTRPQPTTTKKKLRRGGGTPVPTPRPSRRNCMQRQSIFGTKFGHV